MIPFGHLLHARPERSFAWGYGQIPIFGALVAVGAGLHVAAYYLEHHSALSSAATVLCVAIPVAAYVALLYALYAQVSHTWDPFHALLIGLSAAVVVASVVLAAAGVSLAWCLVVLALTPWVTVVGYEAVGHRHNEEVLDSLES